MPLRAGTALDRRSFLARSAGLALAVYGGAALLPRALEEAAAAGPQQVLVSVFLDGGADSLSLLFPSGDALYRRYRPRLALPASTGLPFAEDERLRWHPSLASLAALHAEGKSASSPASATPAPTSRNFTSRHFWEVGATSEQPRTGRLGRYVDHAGAADNPLQGLSLESRLQPALATARMPFASLDGPDRYSFWTRNVWGDVETRMLDAIAALGAIPAGGDAALAQAGSAARQAARLREQLLPFVPKDDDLPRFASPVAYPKGDDDDFRRRLAGLAAMLGAGLPVRVVALTAPGMYDTPTGSGSRPTACSRSSAISRRGGSPTACSCTCGPSSAAARDRDGARAARARRARTRAGERGRVRVTLSRAAIPARPAIVQLATFGEDEHDLRLKRAGGTRVYRIGTVAPGGVAELEARLLAGRFTLWCSLADHRTRGMSATLLVRKR